MKQVDLHLHSTASDGSVPPAELPLLGARLGLAAMALTDHDTVAGVPDFLVAADTTGITGIPGIEISSNGPWGGEVHVVGLFVNLDHRRFQSQVRFLQEARGERNRKMVARLQALGAPITLADWEAAAGGEIAGRLHLADLLVSNGFCRDRREAFQVYIGPGGKAFVPKERMTTAEAVRFLRETGAVPVLAHPGLLPVQGGDLRAFLIDLKDAGLLGLECIHSDHRDHDVGRFLELAARLGLAPSGGSDFHGSGKPHVQLGEPPVPKHYLDGLLVARETASPQRL